MKTGVNTKLKRTETRLSIALLAILVLVGTGVYQRQFEFNPAVLAIRPEFRQDRLSAESNRKILIDATGSGITPFSPPERFGPDSLYEKINGRADLYLASGFVSLQTQRFAMADTPDRWVEVFVYDMATPENAFSVFSMQRRTGDQVENKTASAYHTENAMFMTHGRFYLEFIGTTAAAEEKQIRESLSRRFMAEHDLGPQPSFSGKALFPEKEFETGSFQLIASNAFGHESLDQVYTGDFLTDGARLTAFVSVRENTEEASILVENYQQALLSYGATAMETATGIDGAALLQVFDTYEIIFNRGKFFAGVHEAQHLEKAIRLANDLSSHLEKFRER